MSDLYWLICYQWRRAGSTPADTYYPANEAWHGTISEWFKDALASRPLDVIVVTSAIPISKEDYDYIKENVE